MKMTDKATPMTTYQPEFTKICDGLIGAEGPIFDKNGDFCMVAPTVEKEGVTAGEILAVNLATSEVTLRCAPNFSGCAGIPAGCRFDKDGNLFIADMRLGILKLSKDNTCIQVAIEDTDGNKLQGCNDCIFDADGFLWVTAPASAIMETPFRRSSTDRFGSFYCMAPDGKVTKIDTGFLFSNGIAVKNDSDGRPSKVIVAETHTKSLWSYDIVAPGTAKNKHLWGVLPGDILGGPDGMDFDEEGNLLVAHWGSGHIEVFGPNGGSPHTRIKCPFDKPSNVDFLPGTSELYITEHDNDALWKTTWKNKGRKHFCCL